MAAKKLTIAQLARDTGVEMAVVSKAARDVLGLSGGEARDPHYLLDPGQCRRLRDALGIAAPAAAVPGSVDPDTVPSEPEPPLSLRDDPPAVYRQLTFGPMNHALLVHPEVMVKLETHPHLLKRVGIVLHHLAAHGRTSVVKGCRDDANRGWRRSPLGGSNGMQFYLWWTPQGGGMTRAMDLAEGEIVVRAARHHDDHAPLLPGAKDDYYDFTQTDIEDDGLIGCPWTADQLRFVEAGDPVRLVMGRPGSGKTTVLWKAVETRENQEILYLTWSRELTRFAREHFQSFAPDSVRCDTLDFASFLGAICGADVARVLLCDSRARFVAAVKEQLHANQRGPWEGRETALYAEIRAFLFGRAVPGEDGCTTADGLPRLCDARYLRERGNGKGIGGEAAESLLKACRTLDGDAFFPGLFPEFTAAACAIDRLRADTLPPGFERYDRIVVDEVQDLTLLEAAVIVELCRAIARRRGSAPGLLMAGDDGQTVRPSGFEWGPLSELIARRVGTPSKYQLEENLRCPARIARVIEQASASYAHLEKIRRPTKQGGRAGGQHVDAHLFHVEVAERADAVKLLRQLLELERVVVLTPTDAAPGWVPPRLRDRVLTPAEAKGLEYQSVVLLDPGPLLAGLQPGMEESGAAELEEHQRRTTIDQLRVALSRATETLAFVDVQADPAAREFSRQLLGDAAPFDPEDLAEHLAGDDLSPEERILARTQEARAHIDDRPKRAWQCACQALRLLGNPELPNGVTDEAVRREARDTLVTIAARLLVDGLPPGVRHDDVVALAREALASPEEAAQAGAFERLETWCRQKASGLFPLLDAVVELGREGEWLRDALVPVTQSLRAELEASAARPAYAPRFAGDVEGWLQATGFTGDVVTGEARRLRCKATDTLIERGEAQEAAGVHARIVPEDHLLTGRLREKQQQFIEAAKAFERAGAGSEAYRNWRSAGEWESALRYAEGADRADLDWLIALGDAVGERPDSLEQRLTPGDADRLRRLLDAAAGPA